MSRFLRVVPFAISLALFMPACSDTKAGEKSSVSETGTQYQKGQKLVSRDIFERDWSECEYEALKYAPRSVSTSRLGFIGHSEEELTPYEAEKFTIKCMEARGYRFRSASEQTSPQQTHPQLADDNPRQPPSTVNSNEKYSSGPSPQPSSAQDYYELGNEHFSDCDNPKFTHLRAK